MSLILAMEALNLENFHLYNPCFHIIQGKNHRVGRQAKILPPLNINRGIEGQCRQGLDLRSRRRAGLKKDNPQQQQQQIT